jgi:hydrogenase maturation protease
VIRILCCGNRDRGDDAAALLVAERLQQSGVSAGVHEGDPLGIIENWNPTDDVIVVDATVTGAPAGTMQVWEIPLPASPCRASASTHGLGVAEAIRLAQTLGRLPRRLRVYGIEGKQFHAEAGVSREVLQAVERVARRIADELTPIAAGTGTHSGCFPVRK